MKLPDAAAEAKLADLAQRIAVAERAAVAAREAAAKGFDAWLNARTAELPPIDGALRRDYAKAFDAVPEVMVMEEEPRPRPAYVLERGSYDRRGAEVTAATPEVLPPLPRDARATGSGSRAGRPRRRIRSPRASP